MKSFALSYKLRKKTEKSVPESKEQDSRDEELNLTNIVAEAHVNIWKVPVGTFWSTTKFFFDFGLKFSPEIEYICLFVPFDFKENGKDFDLVRKLKDSNQLLCTVFNMDLKSDSSQKAQFSKVIDEEKDAEVFCLYQLGASKFEIEQVNIGQEGKTKIIGSLLRIHIQEKPDSSICKPETSLYIRFRIEPKRVKDVVSSEHISNDLLQDAFSEIDMIDFRLNEQRDIHTDVIDKIKGHEFKFFSFDKVHLFFMAETKENIQNGSSLKIDSRFLERDLWQNYIPDGAKDTTYIAHHWKKRKEKTIRGETGEEDKVIYTSFKDYRIFFTSVYPKIKWIRLIVYLSVVILLSWIGSMLSFNISSIIGFSIPQYIKAIIIVILLILVISYSIFTTYRIIIRLFRK